MSGRWKLGPAHSDVEAATARHLAAVRRNAPDRAPRSVLLETPSKPSKLITLLALLVERVVAASGSAGPARATG